jgi:hypothetical protein
MSESSWALVLSVGVRGLTYPYTAVSVREFNGMLLKTHMQYGSKALSSVRRWNDSGGIATGYGLDGRLSISSKGKKSISTPKYPDRLWCPPSLMSNVYRGFLERG